MELVDEGSPKNLQTARRCIRAEALAEALRSRCHSPGTELYRPREHQPSPESHHCRSSTRGLLERYSRGAGHYTEFCRLRIDLHNSESPHTGNTVLLHRTRTRVVTMENHILQLISVESYSLPNEYATQPSSVPAPQSHVRVRTAGIAEAGGCRSTHKVSEPCNTL